MSSHLTIKDKPHAVNAIIFSVLPAERQVRATIRVSQTNLEKSLSSRVDIQMDQNGCFLQASMLEAFNNFREDCQESLQKPPRCITAEGYGFKFQ